LKPCAPWEHLPDVVGLCRQGDQRMHSEMQTYYILIMCHLTCDDCWWCQL
jgi:hypothetical protein